MSANPLRSIQPSPSGTGWNRRNQSIDVVLVTAATAAEWLEKYNTHNRDTSQAWANIYAEDMRHDRWIFNGDPIRFDKHGVLIDGQHRLWAVVLSGKAQRFLVIRDLDREAQLTVDVGNRRTPYQQLQVADISVDKSIAGAIRVYLRWTTGRFFGDQKLKVTTPEIVTWAQQNPQEVENLRALNGMSFVRLVPCAPSIVLAIALRFYAIDEEAAHEFFAGLATGAGLEELSPILALRNRLLKDKTRGIKSTDKDLVGLFVAAWNAHRDGRTLSKLQKPHGGNWSKNNYPKPR